MIVNLIDCSNVEHVDSMVTTQRSKLPKFLMRTKVKKLPAASATRHAAFSTVSDNQSDSEGFYAIILTLDCFFYKSGKNMQMKL